MPGRSCQEKTFRGSGSVNRHIQIMNEAKASYAQRLALRRVSTVVRFARGEAHDVRPAELDGLQLHHRVLPCVEGSEDGVAD